MGSCHSAGEAREPMGRVSPLPWEVKSGGGGGGRVCALAQVRAQAGARVGGWVGGCKWRVAGVGRTGARAEAVVVHMRGREEGAGASTLVSVSAARKVALVRARWAKIARKQAGAPAAPTDGSARQACNSVQLHVVTVR